MQATELRIGNWVTENGRLIHIHDGFGIDHGRNFEPIPLNDSNFTIALTVKFYRDSKELHIPFYKNESGYIYALGGRTIKYFHELQNLVWELERTEIEFKNDALQ